MCAYYKTSKKGRYYKSSSRNKVGLEKALQHIHEAEELSEELGGTDKDVKQYFFSLSGNKLSKILDVYEQQYGTKARDYAEHAMPFWKSGKRKMSGMVATRLFKLLPNFMPLESKYELVKDLWSHYCPKTSKVMIIGPDASSPILVNRVQDYLKETINSYKVPEPLNKRFQWLAQGDVQTYQQLLNHFLFSDMDFAISDAKKRIPVIFEEIRKAGSFQKRISREIKLGKHNLNLVFDPEATGIELKSPSAIKLDSKGNDSNNYQKWFIGIAIVVVLYLIATS